jgi:hypothetical protein
MKPTGFVIPGAAHAQADASGYPASRYASLSVSLIKEAGK